MQAEFSFQPVRVQPALAGFGSCRRCDIDQQTQRANHWGFNDNNLPTFINPKIYPQFRSGGSLARSPRVAAAKWRDRW